MANPDNTQTQEPANKIAWGGKVDANLYAVIDRLRLAEDRPFSNMVERLLKTHPDVKPLLETEAAGAGA